MLKYWRCYSTVEAERTHSSESQFQEDLLRQRVAFVGERERLSIATMATHIGIPHAAFKKFLDGEVAGSATCCKPAIRWLDTIDQDWRMRMEKVIIEAKEKPQKELSENDKLFLKFLRVHRQKGGGSQETKGAKRGRKEEKELRVIMPQWLKIRLEMDILSQLIALQDCLRGRRSHRRRLPLARSLRLPRRRFLAGK